MNKIMSCCVIDFRLGSLCPKIWPLKKGHKVIYNVPIVTVSHRKFSSQFRDRNEDAIPSYMTTSDTLSTEECKALIKDMVVFDNFLSEMEEKTLLEEVEPYMTRLHYEYDHWDNVSNSDRGYMKIRN